MLEIINIDHGTCSDAMPILTISDGYFRYTIRSWNQDINTIKINPQMRQNTYTYP